MSLFNQDVIFGHVIELRNKLLNQIHNYPDHDDPQYKKDLELYVAVIGYLYKDK